jgi:uncharacterized protein with HEPN domain
MLEAATEALGFAHAKLKDELLSNRMAVLAIVKDIEIIGEAASKISDETMAKCAEIP